MQNNGKELIQSIHITNIEGKQIQFVDYFGGIQSESKLFIFHNRLVLVFFGSCTNRPKKSY